MEKKKNSLSISIHLQRLLKLLRSSSTISRFSTCPSVEVREDEQKLQNVKFSCFSCLWIFCFFTKYLNTTNMGEEKWHIHFVLKYNLNWLIEEISQHCLHNAWCWLYGLGGGFGILGSWVQIPLDCWIHTRWGWLCLSSFWGRQNECQHAGVLCRSGDPSSIGP